MHYNFEKTAIKCSEWSEMLALAKLAEAQGYNEILFGIIPHDGPYFFFTEQNEGLKLYTDGMSSEGYNVTTYAAFMAAHENTDIPPALTC